MPVPCDLFGTPCSARAEPLSEDLGGGRVVAGHGFGRRQIGHRSSLVSAAYCSALITTGRQSVFSVSSSGICHLRKRLSPTTVHAVAVTISAALNHALRKGEVSRNVAKLADVPTPGEREQAIWTPEQTVQFLELTKAERLYPLYLTAMATEESWRG